MDFVSLRSYLEHGSSARPRTRHGDSTTLSTCSDEATAVIPSNMCSFQDDNFCNVFDSIQPFPGEDRVERSIDVERASDLKIVSTLVDVTTDCEFPRVEPKPPRTREVGEVKQLKPSVIYSEPPLVSSSRSPSKDVGISKIPQEPTRHCHLWGHGKVPTFIALLLAWSGFFCAVACRYSTDFAILREPFYVAPMYQPLTRVGMIRMKLCFNETIADAEGCEVIRLSPPEVEDRLFNVARSLLTMATCLGAGLTLVLTTSIFWESINLRPLAFAFVMTYLMQSFSLFFFGSKLCNEYRCRVSQGSILCIVTSLLWIGASFSVFKMDVFKLKAQRKRRREARRRRRAERRELRERQQREQELANMTAASTDTDETNTAAPYENYDIEEATIGTSEAVIQGQDD